MPELVLKLGKQDPLRDPRNIKFKNIISIDKLPVIPDTIDLDIVLSVVDDRMFLNNVYGDCVIADRAHHTIRFEAFEQKKVINILDEEVKTQYFKETGGSDSGLVMLNSLNNWRQNGWTAAGQDYHIHAYASVDWKDHQEVKEAIFLLNGVSFGMQVAQSAIDQFNAGQGWSVVSGSDGGIVGGHAVYSVAYSQVGPIVVTWGRRVQATWDFWDKYVDECYAIIDNKDDWADPANDPLNIPQLEQYLQEITGQPIPPPVPPIPPIPKPPGCLFSWWPFRRKK